MLIAYRLIDECIVILAEIVNISITCYIEAVHGYQVPLISIEDREMMLYLREREVGV